MPSPTLPRPRNRRSPRSIFHFRSRSRRPTCRPHDTRPARRRFGSGQRGWRACGPAMPKYSPGSTRRSPTPSARTAEKRGRASKPRHLGDRCRSHYGTRIVRNGVRDLRGPSSAGGEEDAGVARAREFRRRPSRDSRRNPAPAGASASGDEGDPADSDDESADL